MSPGAAPPLPSQLKVHLSFCSANLWLIDESFVSFDQAFPCCCFVCDLPTELPRSHHCLTLTSSGWDTLQIINLCYSVHYHLFVSFITVGICTNHCTLFTYTIIAQIHQFGEFPVLLFFLSNISICAWLRAVPSKSDPFLCNYNI